MSFNSFVHFEDKAVTQDARRLYYFFPQIMRDIEDFLSKMCHDRTEPTEEECDEAVDTDFLPPYIPENGRGARLTMSSSVPLLYR